MRMKQNPAPVSGRRDAAPAATPREGPKAPAAPGATGVRAPGPRGLVRAVMGRHDRARSRHLQD